MSSRPDGVHPARLRRIRRTVACVVLAGGMLLAGVGGAAGNVSDQDDAQADARLVLGELQAVVGPPTPELAVEEELTDLPPTSFTARLLIENPGSIPLEGARLVVEAFSRATSRSELRAVLAGADGPLGGRGAPLVDDPLPTIAPGDVLQYTLTLDAAATGMVDEAHDVTVRPLVLSVALGTVVLDEVRTASVGVARTVQRPVETAIVVALDGPALSTSAAVSERAVELGPGGRFQRLLRAVEQDPAAITMAPAAHTLEDLEAAVAAVLPGATSLRDRVRAAAAAGPAGVVSSAYGLADVPALLADPTTADVAERAVAAGRDRLQDLTGRSPGAAHLSVAPPTVASMERSPVDVLVVPWSDPSSTSVLDVLDVPAQDVTGAHHTVRTPSGRTIDVLVGDPWVTALLAAANGQHGWSVDAHRIVVESAMLFAEQPGHSGRPLVVLPPVGWDAPGTLPWQLTRRLLAAPWLRVAPAVTVAAQAELSQEMWTPALSPSGPMTGVTPRVAAVDERLDGVLSALRGASAGATATEDDADGQDGDGPDQQDAPPTASVLTESAHDDLLRAVSRWPDRDPVARAVAALDAVAARVDASVGEVVVPADSAITLTSERGVIPITVQHPSGEPIEVVVEVTTQGRLTFEEGAEQRVLLAGGGTSNVSFEATALGRGTFPLAVTVRTPDRQVVLARALVSVRATAVSRPALAVIGVVVLVLLLLGRRRRPAAPKLEVVR